MLRARTLEDKKVSWLATKITVLIWMAHQGAATSAKFVAMGTVSQCQA